MKDYIPPNLLQKAKEMDLLTYLMNFNPSELVKVTEDTYSSRAWDEIPVPKDAAETYPAAVVAVAPDATTGTRNSAPSKTTPVTAAVAVSVTASLTHSSLILDVLASIFSADLSAILFI